MLKIIIVGLGGFIGAVSRYLISGYVHQILKTEYPVGTVVVNALGCFTLGLIMYLVQNNQMFSSHFRLFMTIGVLGAMTTFSTFGYETFNLLVSTEYKLALYNIIGNVVIGILAVWSGYVMLRVIKV